MPHIFYDNQNVKVSVLLLDMIIVQDNDSEI